MAEQDRNTEQIREFLSRGPVIRMGIGLGGIPPHLLNPSIPPPAEAVPVDPTSVEITTEIVYDERDDPPKLAHESHHGIIIRGFNGEHLTPELQRKITEYLTECLAPMLGLNLDEATLKQPIILCSAFFEGLKVAGLVKDYDFRFDLEHSSHRTRSIAYVVNIQPIDEELWMRIAHRFWDHFVAIVTDTRSPTIAQRFPELALRWGKVAADLLRDLTSV